MVLALLNQWLMHIMHIGRWLLELIAVSALKQGSLLAAIATRSPLPQEFTYFIVDTHLCFFLPLHLPLFFLQINQSKKRSKLHSTYYYSTNRDPA